MFLWTFIGLHSRCDSRGGRPGQGSPSRAQPHPRQEQHIDEVQGLALLALQPGLSPLLAECLPPLLDDLCGEAVHSVTGLPEAPPVRRKAVDEVYVVMQAILTPDHQGTQLNDGRDVIAHLPVEEVGVGGEETLAQA